MLEELLYQIKKQSDKGHVLYKTNRTVYDFRKDGRVIAVIMWYTDSHNGVIYKDWNSRAPDDGIPVYHYWENTVILREFLNQYGSVIQQKL